MNTVTPGVSRNIFKKRKAVKLISILLVVALLAGGAYVFVKAKNNKANGAVTQRISIVVRGTLTDSITGSAPIQSANRSELSPKVTATLEQINCREGDQVKAGDVLFVLDNTDALLNIENAENNIDQMQLTLDSTAKSVSGLAVEAPYSGQVTNINVKLGDTVSRGGTVLTITDMSKLSVTLPFSGAAVKNVAVGQKATVYLQDLMLSVEGSVTYKSSRPYTTASGGELYNVDITINNPGSLREGMKASAEMTVGGVLLDSTDSGTLSYINNKVLKSDSGGTVTSLKVRENEFVNAGDVLMQLENDDLLLTSSSNDMKMENLKAQMDIQRKQLTYYSIVAPFDGTITKLGSANEGDTVKQGEVLAVVSDMGHLEFEVSIDELDISQIDVGQVVKITADAIEETATTPLTGKVSKVAMEGSSSNGVTTYPVTIAVDDSAAGKLKTGMNIDAEILISDKSDVLMVPLEAVIKMGNKSFVYVKGISDENEQSGQSNRNSQGQGDSNNPKRTMRRNNTSGAAFGARANSTSMGAVQGNFTRAAQRRNGDSYYAGAALVEVETGIRNDTHIEILSGLTEGQEVVMPKVTANSNLNSNSNGNFKRGQGQFIGGAVRANSVSGGPGGF